FLAKPHATVKTTFDLRDLRLNYLEPALHHFGVALRRGTMSARGTVEYGADWSATDLWELDLTGADVTYTYAEETPAPERRVAEKAVTNATQAAEKSNDVVNVERATIRDGTVAMVNASTDPNYRLFLAVKEAYLTNFSNRLRQS